jgi:hypothetical protein
LVDRFAVFVDAGYAYAAGGILCYGEKRRDRLRLDFESFLADLVETAANYSRIEHLRTYWYNGATRGVPSPSHQAVGRLGGVKLRLGQMNNEGQQKGVDSLIVRDLMKLSGEHAIATAFLLSGDEDLRQGMIEAQDCGVKVVLMGIEPCFKNQSETLQREADDHIALDATFVSKHLALRPVEAQEQHAAGEAGSGDAVENQANPALEKSSQATSAQTPSPSGAAHRLGVEFGREWQARVTSEELRAVVEMKAANRLAAVPTEVDRELLARGRREFGLDIQADLRRAMRNGFWSSILPSGLVST